MNGKKVLPWHRSPIDKALFKSLTVRSDGKALRHLLAHLGLVALLGFISYRAFKEYPIYLSIPIYFVFTNVFIFLGLSSGIHEMSHGTVFRTKWLNSVCMRFVSFITWSDYVFYRESHMRHHQYTAHHGLEQEVVLPMKLRIRDFVYSLVGNPYYTFKTYKNMFRRALGIIRGEWEEEIFPPEAINKRRELIRWNRILWVGHLLIVGVIIVTQEWLFLLLITLPMASSSIASYTVTMSQHSGLQPDIADSRKCCRSVKINPVYEFLYWNMNYHIEHHMYAGVPFYNLKQLSKALEADMPQRKSLYQSYKEIIQIQKQQKVEPNYYYEAQCPKG